MTIPAGTPEDGQRRQEERRLEQPEVGSCPKTRHHLVGLVGELSRRVSGSMTGMGMFFVRKQMADWFGFLEKGSDFAYDENREQDSQALIKKSM